MKSGGENVTRTDFSNFNLLKKRGVVRLRLGDIASAMGAIGDFETGTGPFVCRIQTDSRLVRPGDLFVCIVGRNMDGHLFAADAVKKGAGAVVAHTPLENLSLEIPILLVRDTLRALGDLAAFWRTKTRAKVIGITGSAGKTTVKEMLAQVLGLVGETAKNYKSWNNQLGLPLSILECSGEEQFWVMEAGISQLGDMEDLGRILRPDYVLINNIGPCHLDGLKDMSGVAHSKAILLDYMNPEGTAVVSADYPELVEEIAKKSCRIQFFTTRDIAGAWRGEYLGSNESGQGEFSLAMDTISFQVQLSVAGPEIGEDVTAVASMSHLLGISGDIVAKGLSRYTPLRQRFCVQTRGKWTIIDDTYNANPLSMRGAIQRAAGLCQGTLVLVLGEMKELGAYTAKAHQELGKWARDAGASVLFFAGEHAADVRKGLGDWNGTFIPLTSPASFKNGIVGLQGGGTMLFKGSRSCRMEEYLEALPWSPA